MRRTSDVSPSLLPPRKEHKTDEMHTALMEASMDGHVEVAKLLLDSGAQVTHRKKKKKKKNNNYPTNNVRAHSWLGWGSDI